MTTVAAFIIRYWFYVSCDESRDRSSVKACACFSNDDLKAWKLAARRKIVSVIIEVYWTYWLWLQENDKWDVGEEPLFSRVRSFSVAVGCYASAIQNRVISAKCSAMSHSWGQNIYFLATTSTGEVLKFHGAVQIKNNNCIHKSPEATSALDRKVFNRNAFGSRTPFAEMLFVFSQDSFKRALLQ